MTAISQGSDGQSVPRLISSCNRFEGGSCCHNALQLGSVEQIIAPVGDAAYEPALTIASNNIAEISSVFILYIKIVQSAT